MTSSTEPLKEEFRYWAFISYSTKDRRIAKDLHKKLETYRIPSALAGKPMSTGETRPKRLFPVFRDRDELSADTSLAKRIESALHSSRYLIVVCSRHAARSEWVNKEIAYFQSLGRTGRILAIIVDGNSSANNADACFPPALRGCDHEPLAADMRKTGDGGTDARLKLLAKMLDVEFDDLKQRNARRRIIQLEYILVVSLLLVVVFAGMAWYSNHQRAKAVEARQQAENMVEFLLFDLREKLDPIGRLDILRDVQKNVDLYYRSATVNINQPDRLRNRSAAYQNDGLRLLSEGKMEDALSAFLASQRINEDLTSRDPLNPIWQRDLFVSTIHVGDVLLQRGDLIRAAHAYQSGLKRQMDLKANEPNNYAQKRDLAVCYGKLGEVYRCQGDLTNALNEYRTALLIREELVKTGDAGERPQRELSVSQEKVGDIFLAQDNLPEATRYYQASLQTREQLVQGFPGNKLWQRELAVIHEKLGDLSYDSGEMPKALIHYQSSFLLRKQLVTTDPENEMWQRDVSVSHEKIGDVLMEQDNLSAALTEYEASLNTRIKLTSRDKSNANLKRDLWIGYWKMAEILERKNDSSNTNYWRLSRDVLLELKEQGIFLSPQDLEALNVLCKKVSAVQR